jgi:anti-anti-sigma factor
MQSDDLTSTRLRPSFNAGGEQMEYQIADTASTTEVRLKGRMEFSDHRIFRELIDKLGGVGQKSVVFDLSGLEFIDSSGLGMLIIARNLAQQKKVDFRLTKPRETVRRVLEIAKFASIAQIDS